MSLSAVVVHYGDPHLTDNLIEALRSSPLVSRMVIVLHDTYSLTRKESVEWIEDENRGYAAGLNRSVRHLSDLVEKPDHVLAINPDVRIDPETIERLHTEHIASQADCTFPVLRENNHLIYGYRFSKFGAMISTSQAHWHSGACFLFTIGAWKRIGGFDESYFHYFEDRDFCLRLQRAGLRSHQACNVIVEHVGKSNADYPATDLPKFAVRNHLIALERSHLLDPLTFLNVTTRHFFYLFRWKKGWRGIRKWRRGILEFLESDKEEPAGAKVVE